MKAVVLTGTPRAFSGGADITEFGQGPREPGLSTVIAQIEAFDQPVVAFIAGLALGGGLELALGCHYRVAAPGAKVGLPEVKLGILPGAGGTQRLPRVIGPVAAMKAIVSGATCRRTRGRLAGRTGRDAGRGRGLRPLRASASRLPGRDRDDKLARPAPTAAELDEAAAPLLKRARGQRAPAACIEAVRAAVTLPIDEGLALERKLFGELVASDESRAQRHAFFAEREAQKVPGMPAGLKAPPVAKAAIVGAGTMGGGIAMCFANAGIPVTLIEAKQEALDRGMAVIEKNYRTAVSPAARCRRRDVAKRMALFSTTTDFAAASDADVVIEAVFETMEVKREVFTKLDAIAKPGALLASNTSTLDVDQIAGFTKRPQDVLGMHFFSPANVMKLLEIVRGKQTSYESIARALAIGRTIGKVSAVVGVCDGFVGNRMLHKRSAQAEALLLEGALPQQVDAVVTKFGFPMGPYAMGDLAGLDVGWRIRQGRGATAPISDALCEAGPLRPEDRRRLLQVRRPHPDAGPGGGARHRRAAAQSRRQPAHHRRRRDLRAHVLPHDQRGRPHPGGRHRHPPVRHRRDLDQRLRLAGRGPAVPCTTPTASACSHIADRLDPLRRDVGRRDHAPGQAAAAPGRQRRGLCCRGQGGLMDTGRPFAWEQSYPAGMRLGRAVARLHAAADAGPGGGRLCATGPTSSSAAPDLSFREFGARVDRLAAGLRRLGVGPGVSVALFLPNAPYHPISFFAVLRTGARVVHLTPLDPPRALARKLADSGARLLVTHRPRHLAATGGWRCWSDGLLDHLVVGEDAAFGAGPPTLPLPQDGRAVTFAALASGEADTTWPGADPGRRGGTAIYRRHHRPAARGHADPRQPDCRDVHLRGMVHRLRPRPGARTTA